MIRLFQVEAPHFTAGFCVDVTNLVWRTAPILKWMEDKPLYVAESYCRKKGWKLIEIPYESGQEKESVPEPKNETSLRPKVLELGGATNESPQE